jgi:hypothetical protein
MLRESILSRIILATIPGNKLGNIHRDYHFWRVGTANFLHIFLNTCRVDYVWRVSFRCTLSSVSVCTSQRVQFVCIIKINHINACRPSRKQSLYFRPTSDIIISCWQIALHVPRKKQCENPSCESGIFSCGEMDGRIDYEANIVFQ